jgi:hypothetical protein
VPRNLRLRTSGSQSKPGNWRIPKVFRALLCLAAALGLAVPGFAQHYYTKIDSYVKMDNFSKVDGSSRPLADFRRLPVPPIASRCGQNGLACSASNAAVSVRSSGLGTERALDEMAKRSTSSLRSTANHESNRSVRRSKPLPDGRSGQGSGINVSSGGSPQHAGASSSAGKQKRRH